jgi:hypothetical protein
MNDQPLINPSIELDQSPLPVTDISPEDKERFFKSILADKPYEEVVSLFDDQIKVRFRAMTVQENTDVVNQIVADRKAGVAADTDAYFITVTTYRLGVCLLTIDDNPYCTLTKDTFVPFTENDTYILARCKSMRSWSTARLAVFIDAFKKFESKLIKLTGEVQTPNFWKASA